MKQYAWGRTTVMAGLVAASLTTSAGPAQAGVRDATGEVSLVSGTVLGGLGDRPSLDHRWSPDGRKILFRSAADNLVPGDTNGVTDVFVKYLDTGVIRRVSTSATGKQADQNCGEPTWSPDGVHVAFTTFANRLVPGDTNNGYDIFSKNIVTGALVLVSHKSPSLSSNGNSFRPSFSPDGSSIAFSSDASNLVNGDTNDTDDVFVARADGGGVIQRASVTPAGVQGNRRSFGPTWAPDGTRLAFESNATNFAPKADQANTAIYIKSLETGGTLTRISTATDGSIGNQPSSAPAFSPDATMVSFTSSATNLVPGDDNGFQDVFVKVLRTGATYRVSTTSLGGALSQDSISDDGAWSPDSNRLLFISFAPDLVPGDVNNRSDAFEKNLSTGAVRRVSTAARGTQLSQATTRARWAPDGSRVSFATDAPDVIEGDTNGSYDIFVKVIGPALPIVRSITVTGKLKVGSALRCAVTTYPVRPTGVAAKYAWLRLGAVIRGATAATYKTTRADKGKPIGCRVTLVSKAGTIVRTSLPQRATVAASPPR